MKTEYEMRDSACTARCHRPGTEGTSDQRAGAAASSKATPQAVVTRQRGSTHKASKPIRLRITQPLSGMRLCRARNAGDPAAGGRRSAALPPPAPQPSLRIANIGTAQHDEQKPFAPENGQPLLFKAGDPVIYTNQAGIEFALRVTGFYERPTTPDGMYAKGARYLLDWDCPWFPAVESCLRLDESRELQPTA